MRVKIGPYVDWFGPYQLAQRLMFWVPKEKDECGLPHTAKRVHDFGEWLAHGNIEPEPKVGEIRSFGRDRPTTLLYKFLSWIHSKQKRTIKVQIDRWDTWSMDHTLAHIVLPMLRQLKASKHGSPHVDLEDVPENLRITGHEDHEAQHCLDFYHADEKESDTYPSLHDRWEWVMEEMIFAFESKLDDSWEDQFESGVSDHQLLQLENGMSQMIDGPNHTKVYDWEGRQAYEARMQNGFRLFGKYYQNLWD